MGQKISLLIMCFGFTTAVSSQLNKIQITGAELNYLDKGSGTPVVFVHGGMEDYRTWDAQVDSFSKYYRVITYSRRFNYPNRNLTQIKNFSPFTEAKDLAELIIQLKLPPVHLVGHSFGALVALCMAIKYPQLVRTLTLSEPPLISWLPQLPGGKQLHDDFYQNFLQPVKKDFEREDTTAVLRHTLLYFMGEDISAQLPPEARAQLIANLPEWQAIAMSDSAFPYIRKEDIQNLKIPVFLLSAGQTMPVLKPTNTELMRLLPHAQHFQLAEGTHDYWSTNPKQMGDALLNFLRPLSKSE